MKDANSESSKLYCIVEKQLFYYGILQGNRLIKSEQIQINKDFNFLDSPDVIKQFLEQSLEGMNIDKSYFSIACLNYALIPNDIEPNEIQFWLGTDQDDTNDLVVNRFNQMQIAFSLPKEWISELGSLYKNVQIHHILETNLQEDLPSNGVLSYQINGFQLIGLLEKGTLTYQNLVSSSEDLSQLYFSLLPYYILRQDLHKTPLYTVKPTEGFYDKVSTYVANVEVLVHKLDVDSKTELNQAQLFQIQRLYQCAS